MKKIKLVKNGEILGVGFASDNEDLLKSMGELESFIKDGAQLEISECDSIADEMEENLNKVQDYYVVVCVPAHSKEEAFEKVLDAVSTENTLDEYDVYNEEDLAYFNDDCCDGNCCECDKNKNCDCGF